MQITAALLALLVSVIALVHATPVEFDFAITGPFSARTGHTLVSWHGSELLLMGGDDGIVGVPNVRNDIYRSRDGGKSWELLIDHAPWAARELHVAIATPTAIYVIAGGSAKYAFPDVWRSVDGGRTWELRSRGTAPFGIRTYAAGCAIGEQIFLIGGSDGSQALSDVWTSVDGGLSWTKIADNQFRARLGHSAVCVEDGGIVVIGGMLNSASSGILSDEVFRSDDKGLTWTQISGQGITDSDAHFSARAQHAAVSMSGSIVLVGGLTYGPQAYSDMWESRDGGRTWALLGESSVFESEFAPRYGHHMASLSSGHAVLVGGLAGKGFPLADVHKFSLAPVNPKTNTRSYVMHGKRRVHILDSEIGYLFFPELTLTPAWAPNVYNYAVTSPNPVPSALPNQQVRIVHSGNPQKYLLSFLTNGVWITSSIIWETVGTSTTIHSGQFPSPVFDLSLSTGITAVRISASDTFTIKEYVITIRGGAATTIPPILACPADRVEWSVQDANLCDSSCTLKLWTYNYCYRTSTGQTVPLSCCDSVTKPNPLVPCTLNDCVPTSTIPPSTTPTTVIGTTTPPGTPPAVMPGASGPLVYSYTGVPVDICEGFCSVPNPSCNGQPCGGGYQRFTQQCVDARGQPVDNAFCIAAQATPLTANALYKPCTINNLCLETPEVQGAAQCSSIDLSIGSLAPNFEPSTLVYGVVADSFSSLTIRAVALGGESFDILVQDQHHSSKANGISSAPITIPDNVRTKITVRCFSALNFRDYYIYAFRGNSLVSYSWTQVPTGICSRSCTVLDDGTVVSATMNVTASCVNNLGMKVDDSLCSGPKPTYASTSCNVGLICSQNTYLSNLALVNFNIAFDRDKQQYTLKPPCGTSKYTQLTPTLDDPKATITYWKTGGFSPVPVTPIASTATSAGMILENRVNIVQIQVRAQDLVTQRTYFLYIDFTGCPDPVTTTTTPSGGTTQSTSSTSTVTSVTTSTTPTTATTRTTTTASPTCTALNTLSSLSTSLGNGALSPAFDPNVLTYTVHVDSSVSGKLITVYAATADPRALIEARRSPNPYTNFTSSGQDYLMSTGANYIELRVNPCDKSGYVRHYMITVIVGAIIAGDPQITGLQGQDFQVHGTPDEIFNMVSHPDYQVNSRFIFLGKGSARCMDNYTACWTHPGTYIDVLGFNFRTHKIRVNAGKYEEGLRVFIDEKEVIPSKRDYDLGNGMSVSFKRRREVYIRTSLFVFSAVNSDRFLNQKMELLDDSLMRAGSVKAKSGNAVMYPNFPLHGILGQTWKNIVYHHGTGPQIEGHVDDYRVEDQDIYGDQFYFNQFKN